MSTLAAMGCLVTQETAPKARPYHHGDLRLALIEAAEAWMRDRADWAFTLREIARNLGVSHNAPYKHFSDKGALLTVLGERAFHRLGTRLSAEMKGIAPDDTMTLIEAAALAYVGFALEEPAVFRLMFGEELSRCEDAGFRDAADGAFGTLKTVIARGVASGQLRADVGGGHAATAWAMVHGLSLLLIDGRLSPQDTGSTPDHLIRISARTLIDGLRLR